MQGSSLVPISTLGKWRQMGGSSVGQIGRKVGAPSPDRGRPYLLSSDGLHFAVFPNAEKPKASVPGGALAATDPASGREESRHWNFPNSCDTLPNERGAQPCNKRKSPEALGACTMADPANTQGIGELDLPGERSDIVGSDGPRPYRAPQLRYLGSVRELTAGAAGSIGDGLSEQFVEPP
jgi:hypothetical protein